MLKEYKIGTGANQEEGKLEEFIKSIKAYLYDRTSSPLFGGFLLSWVVWNYKFLIVVFSGENYQEEILYISGILYPKYVDVFYFWILFPLVSALFYLYSYPLLSIPVYKYVQEKQRKLREARNQIDEDTLLTEKESRELRLLMFNQQREFEKQLDARDSQIKSLSELLDRAQRTHDSQSSPPQPDENASEDEVDDNTYAALEVFAEQAGSIEAKAAAARLRAVRNLDKVTSEYVIGELKARKLISFMGNGFALSHQGLAALIKERKARQTA